MLLDQLKLQLYASFKGSVGRRNNVGLDDDVSCRIVESLRIENKIAILVICDSRIIACLTFYCHDVLDTAVLSLHITDNLVPHLPSEVTRRIFKIRFNKWITMDTFHYILINEYFSVMI